MSNAELIERLDRYAHDLTRGLEPDPHYVYELIGRTAQALREADTYIETMEMLNLAAVNQVKQLQARISALEGALRRISTQAETEQIGDRNSAFKWIQETAEQALQNKEDNG